MATLMWQRDISSDVNNAKNTFSSWDNCMSEAYCKWPVIVGIIIGALILLSVLFCVARIICFGAECCFCCMSCAKCCTSCCRSSGGSSRDKGYQQQQPPQQPYPPYNQYQSAPPPMYAQPTQFAQFDASSGQKGYRQHDDALPAMPSWENATSRRIEDHSVPEDDDMEMDKLDHPAAQAQPMLPKVEETGPLDGYSYHGAGGDLSTAYAQQTHNPYSSQPPPAQQYQGYGGYAPQRPASSAYEPMRQTKVYEPSRQTQAYEPSPVSPSAYSSYSQPQHQYGGTQYGGSQYGGASVPPSYRTSPPSVNQAVPGRKPVQGTWRDL